jgi:hypothetical protein
MPILAPDGYPCPYRRACWQREAVRIVVTVFVAAMVSWIARPPVDGSALPSLGLSAPDPDPRGDRPAPPPVDRTPLTAQNPSPDGAKGFP